MNILRSPRQSRFTYGLFLAASIMAFAAGDVWLSHARYEISRQTQRELKQRQDLSASLNRLNLELASITRPDRLRGEARKLGMAPPSPMQVIRP